MRILPKLLLTVLACGTAGLVAANPHAAPSSAEPPPGCLDPAVWSALDGERPRITTPGEVIASMAQRDVVLLGERHDEDDHHRWQVQALAALHAKRPDMVIGFEMFPRRVQPVLDRWVAGELTVPQFLAESEWDKVWNMPAELYLPLFQFARINRVPMVALNVDAKLTKTIAEKGWDALPEDERQGVGRPAPASDAYRDFLFEIYRQHAGLRGKDGAAVEKSDDGFRYFVESQTTWDRAMAEALARPLRDATGSSRPLVVGVMGHGHIRFGHGVPHQLRELGIGDVGTLMPVAADTTCDELPAGLADAIFVLPKQAMAKPEPPRLGVQLEEDDGAVLIARVTTGSLAERTGLKSGDRLVEVAGLPAKKIRPVIASIRRQPEGTWLPLRVQRGEETLDLVVKFPAKP